MFRMIVKHAREVQATQQRRQRALKSMRAVHLRAATAIYTWTIRNMNAEGRMHGEPSLYWRPLRSSTIARRVKINKWPGRMLQVTGSLKNGFIPNAKALSGKVENATPYAKYHEYGASGGSGGGTGFGVAFGRRGRLPMRKMFPSERKAREIVFPMFRDHVRVSIE